jgi:tetratricopeptide (TPR) repeat protein
MLTPGWLATLAWSSLGGFWCGDLSEPSEPGLQRSDSGYAVCSLGLAQDPAQEPKEVRDRIDRRIERFKKTGRRLGPGLLRECVTETLAFGVPAYNSGDHEACAQFYIKTAESLVGAFPKGSGATPLGARGLADLKAALDRSAKAKGPEGQAWAMRFAFDQIMIAWEGAAAQLRALMGLASQNFGGSRYAEAAEAFGEAGDLLEDVMGEEFTQADLGLRGASLMKAHACLAQGLWKEAVKAIAAGMAYVPDFPKGQFDLRAIFRADRYEEILGRLKTALEASPEDAELSFLLGYVEFHSGRKDAARGHFEKALKIAPQHAGAKAYLAECPASKKSQDF